MKTLIIFFDAEKRNSQRIRPTTKFIDGKPSYGDWQRLATAIAFPRSVHSIAIQ